MLNELNSDWYTLIESEFKKDYFLNLQSFVNQEYAIKTCFPPKHQIFSAFNLCSINDLKVVIIGQDPYHGQGEANGLCFSVNDNIKIPPSLRNIFKEVNADLNYTSIYENGNLQRWSKQGILLLNATLTVEKDKAASHQKQGWETFTAAVISIINSEKSNIVFLLWGNYAKKVGLKINANKHFILQGGHPSPLSANQGKWFGNKHFSATNNYLKSVKKSQIDW